MKSADPASLQNLNDIVLPAATGWWPLAGGWYFLFAVLLIAITWTGYRLIQRWIRNRYRRAALGELQAITKDIQHSEKREYSLRQLPILLKRTALSAYPRAKVASLSGDDWFEFLNSQLENPTFTQSTSDLLNNISYSTGDLSTIDAQATTDLLNATKHWLKHHQPVSRNKTDRKV